MDCVCCCHLEVLCGSQRFLVLCVVDYIGGCVGEDLEVIVTFDGVRMHGVGRWVLARQINTCVG